MATLKSLSIEDRNLNKVTSIVSSKINAYKDIDLTFAKKSSNDIFKKIDAASIKQSVKNIVLGNHYEKPFMPFWGANLTSLLFELGDNIFPIDIENSIKGALYTYEPRVKVLDIISDIQPDRNYINVTLEFQIVSSNETQTLNFSLTRLR